MLRRDLNAPDAHPPVAAYTHAIEVSGATRTLYISGQVGQRMDGTIPDDIVEQSRLAWQNLEAQLKAAGMTLDNLSRSQPFCRITAISPLPAKGAASCLAIASPREL
jgi:2-iminobutanoate/2-iminopropanoate deaminase